MKKIMVLLTALLLLVTAAAAEETTYDTSFTAGGEATPKGEYVFGNAALEEFELSGTRLTRLGTMDLSANFFGGTHYLLSTLPDGISSDSTFSSCSLVMTKSDSVTNAEWEWPVRYAVEFVSGDPAFKNIFSFEQGYNGDEPVARIAIDLTQLHEHAGEATFRFTLENSRCYLQEERTLRVVPYDEDPLCYSVYDPLVIHLRKGENSIFIDPNSWFENYSNNIVLQAAKAFLYPGKSYPIKLNQSRFTELHGENPFSWMPWVEQPYEDLWIFVLPEGGRYDITFPVSYGELDFDMPVRFFVSEKSIAGPEYLAPGGEADYSVEDPDDAGTEYYWSLFVEEECAVIDPGTGHLTLSEDAPRGHRLMVMVTPNDSSDSVFMNVTIR